MTPEETSNEEATVERPPPTRYEITWANGHTEYVVAHQVIWPSTASALFGGPAQPSRIMFHAYIDGVWTLQLSALEEDIRTVRNAATETAAGESS